MATDTFEKALIQLEKIVAELEAGNLPLEKALKKFEEGVAFSRFCSEKLDESESKIALLLKDPQGILKEQRIDSISDAISNDE
jgi:exodeoxyribonuclease VII small subunit